MSNERKVTAEEMLAVLNLLAKRELDGRGFLKTHGMEPPLWTIEEQVIYSEIGKIIVLQPLVEKLVEACGLIEKIGYEDGVWEIRKALAAYLQTRDGKGE